MGLTAPGQLVPKSLLQKGISGTPEKGTGDFLVPHCPASLADSQAHGVTQLAVPEKTGRVFKYFQRNHFNMLAMMRETGINMELTGISQALGVQ